MGNVIDFDGYRIEPFMMSAIEGFLRDPPGTDFERGYLAGLLVTYKEGLRPGSTDHRLALAESLLAPAADE